MKCDDCKFAEWKKTANGRLHPDKTGRCAFKWDMPPVPRAFYWLGGKPRPCGGMIDRGNPDKLDDCPCFKPMT